MDWSPRREESAVLTVAGLALAAATVLLDPAGRLLVGAAAALLLGLAARDLLLRPRLSAGPGGLAVRTLTGTLRLPWAGLDVRVRESRRWGLRSRLLELDAGQAGADGPLVLLGRRDLGVDPAVVARALASLHPDGGGDGP